MRLNLHARIEISLALALLLGSCDNGEFHSKFTDAERDEIGDIAGDAAGEAIADDSKVRDLEGRVEAIEQRLNM